MKLKFLIMISAIYLHSGVKIVVLIPSYNNSKWYKENLDSVLSQNFQDFRILYADDCSSDQTPHLVENYIKKSSFDQDRFKIVINKKRKTALKNIYDVIHNYCNDDEIIVLLDGDDQLADNSVLSYIANLYESNEIWMTYGTHIDKSSRTPCSWSLPYPKDIIESNSFRSWHHGAVTHMRTFYAWLFKKIKKDDLLFNGQFFPITYDVAMFMPMIEMSGSRHMFVSKNVYIYNDLNDLNDHKLGKGVVQLAFNTYIRNLPPYQKLN